MLTYRAGVWYYKQVAETDKTCENAGVAQLVEQLICNQQVGGSSPSTSSTPFEQRTILYGRFPEWPKGTDCKSVVYDFGGSNPPPPTSCEKHSEWSAFLLLCCNIVWESPCFDLWGSIRSGIKTAAAMDKTVAAAAVFWFRRAGQIPVRADRPSRRCNATIPSHTRKSRSPA